MRMSMESSALMKECAEDIREFGEMKAVAVWYLFVNGVPLIRNYDFFQGDEPILFSELEKGEAITKMTLGEVLAVLNEQNKI